MQPRCVHTPTTTSHSGFLDAVGILLRVAQRRDINILRRLDLLRRAVADKDRFAAPCDGQALPGLHRREIDLRAGKSQRVGGGIEAVDKRPDRACRADGAERPRGQDQEVAPRAAAAMRLGNVRVCRIGHPQPRRYAAEPRPRRAPPRLPRGKLYR